MIEYQQGLFENSADFTVTLLFLEVTFICFRRTKESWLDLHDCSNLELIFLIKDIKFSIALMIKNKTKLHVFIW